jgi:hypothetical protein
MLRLKLAYFCVVLQDVVVADSLVDIARFTAVRPSSKNRLSKANSQIPRFSVFAGVRPGNCHISVKMDRTIPRLFITVSLFVDHRSSC